MARKTANTARLAWLWLLLTALPLAGCGGGSVSVGEGLINPPRLSVVCLQVEYQRPELATAGKPAHRDIAEEARYQLSEAGLLVPGPGLNPTSGGSAPLNTALAGGGCPARLRIALNGRVTASPAWTSSVALQAWAYMMMTLEVKGEPLLLLRYNGPQVRLSQSAPSLGPAERSELSRRLSRRALSRAAGELDYAAALARFVWRMQKLGLSPY